MAPPPPPPGYGGPYMAPPPPPPPARGGSGGIITRIAAGLVTSVLMISICLNVYFFFYLAIVRASIHAPSESTYVKGKGEDRIVILPVNGTINDEMARNVHDSLAALREKPPKVLILRVDSGGGGVAASDRIWHEIKMFKQDTNVPIIASFGSVAASGGYYIAAPADYIFSEPTGITGSIGVMAPVFTVDKLLEKVGVTPETIIATDSPRKDVANDIMRPWNEADRERVLHLLDSAYERFVEVVHDGRKAHLDEAQVRVLASGDIYTTQQAVDNKLIDAAGYLDDAIAHARTMAGLSKDVPVTVISPAQSFSLMNLVAKSNTPSAEELLNSENFRKWMAELTTFRMEYRMSVR
jgi:protease-4